MRISDWSSDVCSSDLTHVRTERRAVRVGHAGFAGFGAEQYPFLPEQRHIAQFAGLQRVRIVDEEPAGRNRERAAFQRLRLAQNLEIDLITHFYLSSGQQLLTPLLPALSFVTFSPQFRLPS